MSPPREADLIPPWRRGYASAAESLRLTSLQHRPRKTAVQACRAGDCSGQGRSEPNPMRTSTRNSAHSGCFPRARRLACLRKAPPQIHSQATVGSQGFEPCVSFGHAQSGRLRAGPVIRILTGEMPDHIGLDEQHSQNQDGQAFPLQSENQHSPDAKENSRKIDSRQAPSGRARQPRCQKYAQTEYGHADPICTF